MTCRTNRQTRWLACRTLPAIRLRQLIVTIRVYPDESLASDVETRPIRVDFGANETYGGDHILMRHFGGSRLMATKTGQRKTEASARRAGKLFGYARVSTTDQDLALQREVLERAGANPIFDEKASGTKRDGRTELQRVLSILREGDALVVTRLDRLGRSMRDLANIAHEIEQAEAHLKVIEQSVDTSTAAGRNWSPAGLGPQPLLASWVWLAV
jgi:Resolvase, N terminal domain